MPSFTLGHYSEVCCQLLNNYFGAIVSQVGAYLLRRGHRPLFEIPTATGLPMSEVGYKSDLQITKNLKTLDLL